MTAYVHPRSRSGPSLVAAAIVMLLVLAGAADRAAAAQPGIAAAAADLTAGAVTGATAARSQPAIRYRRLSTLGVRATGAKLNGRTVSVRLRTARPAEVRLAVIRNRQRNLQAWNAVNLKRGTRTLVRRLNKTPTGSSLNLRVTARIGNVRARGIIALKVVQATAPRPQPPPSNRPPGDISLSGATVSENRPAGTTVGTLTASDPNPTSTFTFVLVAGDGSADNGSFAITGNTLATAASFDAETKSSYSIRIRVTNNRGGTFEKAFTITVTNVNEAPAVTTSAGVTAYSENAAAIVLDGGLTVADVDDTSLAGAVVRLSAGFEAGDELVFTNQAGISGTYSAGTGVLTLSGTATKADYQAALRSVRFRQTGDNPSAARTVELKVNDGDLDSVAATKAITIAPDNDAPVVVTSAGPLSYAEGAAATPIDPGVTAGDADSANLASATVQITGDYVNGQDVLAMPLTAGITSSFSAATGLLTLTGPASPAAFQAALRTVTYVNTSNTPSTLARTVTFIVNDGALGSAPAPRTINVTASDNPPAVDNSAGALAYTENDPATAIDAAIAIADSDSTNLAGATVQITGNYVDGQDLLALPAQPAVTASFNAATGTLTLSGTATIAVYETALEQVTYRNTSDNPSTATRTVTYTARDAGGFGASDTHAITIAAVDDAPTAVNDSATVAEDSGATAVTVLTNDTDPDAGPLSITGVTQPANGTVAITGGGAGLTYTPNANSCNSPPGATPDTFTYTLTPGGSTATVSMTVTCADDSPVAVANSTTVAEDSGASAIDVLANDTDIDGGPRSVASVTQPANGTVVNNGTGATYTPNANYCNSPPGTTLDTFTYTLTPGGSTATVSVTVTCSDDAPVAVNDSATVAEDSGASAVGVLANDTDADGGPTLVQSVTQPPNGSVVITGGGTGVSYTPNANYCNDPVGGIDTFTYTLNGGSQATVSVTVTCVTDAPVVDTSAGTTTYTENAAAAPIDAAVTVTDPDAGATITGATVAITANFAGVQDLLALAGIHPGISALQAGNTLTLTGTASPAAYQAALRSVTYANTSEGPSTLVRTVTFTATDNTAQQGSDTKSLQVNAVNDPPTAVDDSGTTDEDSPRNVAAPGVLANDTDVDAGDTKTVVALNGTGSLTQTLPSGASVTINANGSYSYDPLSAFQGLSTGQTASDSFAYTMQDGAGAQDTATVSITVNGISDAPTAVADSFDAIGNTGLFAGTTRPAAQAGKEITGSVLANDTDPDTPQASLVAEPVTNAATTLGGTITIESDGNFTYHPDDVDTAITDTFTYRVCDASPCNSGTVANATGTLSLPIAGQVWYVRNSEPAGGDGTSDTPFDTLAEAEAASGTGDTTFVFDGSNTTTNLDTGYAMNANERLIGESRPLSLDPDGGGPLPTSPLHPGTSGAQPTLTASNEDVVALASNTVVDGVDVDPSGTGGGISGGAGVDAVTVQNVNVTDTGTAGTQPGIELDGTTGVNRFTGVRVTNGGSATAIGVRINNADRVLFANTATNTIATTGAKALDAASTSLLTSRWNDITVTGSGTGAIRLSSTTGQPALGDGAGTDLSLQTTSGATAALDVASSNTVTVDSAGSDTISATGGPAADIRNSNGSQFFFDSASSTNSAGDGINLDTNLTAPFVVDAGTIAGAAGIAVDVNGGGVGGGGVVYAGAINDGSGQSVEVTGRDGGGVTFSGNIADSGDAGGGIAVSGNSDGSTTFSGASKVLNTGAGNAVALSSNGSPDTDHEVSFTSGGLDIDTSSGQGLTSSNLGRLTVGGTGNTITTGTGVGLNVDTTRIMPGNLNFDSVSSNGSTQGIRLNSTGAEGGLNVTGTGGACATTADPCSGGTIQSTTQDAVSLTSAQAITLQRMKIRNSLGNGVRGSSVTNFALRDSVVDNNGDDAATDEAGLHFTNLAGNSEFTRTLVANSPEDNARVVNASGTLSQLNVTDSTFRDTDTVSPGNNGLLLQADGGSITADVLGNTFLRNRANGLQVITNGTGSMNVEVDDSGAAQSSFDDNNIGVSVAHNSSGTFSYGVRDLTIDGLNVAPGTGGSASPININLAGVATTPMVGRVTGNTVTNSNSTTGPGMRFTSNGLATMTTLIDANTISQVANRGIEVIARDGSNRINATISNNSVTLNNALSADAIRVDAGTISTDTTTICADIRGNSATTTAVGLFGVRVRQRFAGTTFILEDYAGAPTDDAAVQAFLSATNNGATTSADHGGAGFTSIADCPNPP